MKNVLEYVEASERRLPLKTAAVDGARSVTYGELASAARAVGTALLGRVGPGRPAAVLLEKGLDALEAFWGAVYAGGCYALLNPELPPPRLRQIQDVLGADCVITDCAHRELAAGIFPARAILLIEELSAGGADAQALARVRERMIDTDPLYINFTSGSTGVPKGVAVSHRSVIDFIDVFTGTFGFAETDVFGNQAPFDFDVSVKDIYTSAKVGGTLAIVPREYFSRPKELLDWLCGRELTVMIWAVSALCLISAFHGLDYRRPERVRMVLFSGEVMPEKHLRAWMEGLPEAVFVNLYGPTEITCNCTYHVIDRARDYSGGIPIGRPFPNERVFLLDAADGEVTLPDTVGEICVGGTALALGYYRNMEQTGRSFVQNPLNDRYPELIYRTGDLGRYDAGGELLFCGRKDFQIKYMGHRIELEEIERVMSAQPGIDRCCCAFDARRERLYGFYTGGAERAALRARLCERLPDYMVPRSLCPVEDFPLTKNGKIDRRRLIEERRRA